ncbi:ubiquitin-like-specific protease 1D isoform X3 [Solanum stenotomum]|uniref:ubiquitin-like-specific protease 1D isoform X3 n=1 Tax=Solanum stenotomum TaxID=172797 RepID=UPI0020CFF7C8|nr:ubiquitin-like-specific protease 1D isoform X3 [Solanum stenotomum]
MARLIIDWSKLIDDKPPVELVVATKATPMITLDDGEEQNDEFSNLRTDELTEKINRFKSLLSTKGPRLVDGGEKLKTTIKKYEAEFERRKLLSSDKGTDGCALLGRHHSSSIGAANGLGQRSAQSAPRSQSAFAVCFSKKLEEKQANSKTPNGFQNELHALNTCGRKRILTKKFSPRRRCKTSLSSREAPFKSPLNIDEREFYAHGKTRDISTSSPRYSEESFSSRVRKEWKPSQTHSACSLRHANDEAVVLLDEEEPDVVEPRQQAHHVVESTKTTKIYYPSRDDPEAVEIYYSDMESLAPEAYLSSTIMNFYIRHLQQRKSPADGERCDYHFFNTYFYSKLKEAVFSKNEKEASFFKLRRWWKGVNIFEKAYIFLPIHESHHWSLVIICIPDKEDQLGPIILHLDSLRLHSSSSLFGTMKKFLIEEWKFLRQGVVADYPFADKIWENLPQRIDDNIIPVPQQGNDYDCGLFVLFFMERFIAEVHERLKKKDLTMFGRKWFKPEEASRMRRIIRDILEEKFKNPSDK